MARSMRPRRGQKAVTIQEDDSSSAASGSRQHLQRRAKDKVYAEKLQSGVTRRALVSFYNFVSLVYPIAILFNIY